jgi:hypothetical protein
MIRMIAISLLAALKFPMTVYKPQIGDDSRGFISQERDVRTGLRRFYEVAIPAEIMSAGQLFEWPTLEELGE